MLCRARPMPDLGVQTRHQPVGKKHSGLLVPAESASYVFLTCPLFVLTPATNQTNIYITINWWGASQADTDTHG